MVRVITSEFRVGLRIEIDGQPYLILQNDFVKPGKGQAFNRIKVKIFLQEESLKRRLNLENR